MRETFDWFPPFFSNFLTFTFRIMNVTYWLTCQRNRDKVSEKWLLTWFWPLTWANTWVFWLTLKPWWKLKRLLVVESFCLTTTMTEYKCSKTWSIAVTFPTQQNLWTFIGIGWTGLLRSFSYRVTRYVKDKGQQKTVLF